MNGYERIAPPLKEHACNKLLKSPSIAPPQRYPKVMAHSRTQDIIGIPLLFLLLFFWFWKALDCCFCKSCYHKDQQEKELYRNILFLTLNDLLRLFLLCKKVEFKRSDDLVLNFCTMALRPYRYSKVETVRCEGELQINIFLQCCFPVAPRMRISQLGNIISPFSIPPACQPGRVPPSTTAQSHPHFLLSLTWVNIKKACFAVFSLHSNSDNT